MIAVCLDWNCIIELEEEREYAPVLQQIREWSKQGKIALCIAGPSRLENHRSKNRGVYNEDEWTEKLRNVGLDGIELRPAEPRFRSYPEVDAILIREIHNRLFPDVPFSLQDYATLKKVELPEPHVFYSFPQSLQEEFEQETPEQRKLRRKWNNKKNDALSLHAFATWGTPDDVFVSTDIDDVIEKRELLKAPYYRNYGLESPRLLKRGMKSRSLFGAWGMGRPRALLGYPWRCRSRYRWMVSLLTLPAVERKEEGEHSAGRVR